jgi:hypothetical protein
MTRRLVVGILLSLPPWCAADDTLDSLYDAYFRLIPEHAMLICGFVAMEDAGYVVIDGYAMSAESTREGWFVIDGMRRSRTVRAALERDGIDTTVIFLNAYIEDVRYGQVVCRPARGGRILEARGLLRRIAEALGCTHE